MTRPKPDASKYYTHQSRQEDKRKVEQAQQSIRDKLGCGKNKYEDRHKYRR